MNATKLLLVAFVIIVGTTGLLLSDEQQNSAEDSAQVLDVVASATTPDSIALLSLGDPQVRMPAELFLAATPSSEEAFEEEYRLRVAELESATAELRARCEALEMQLLLQQYPLETPFGAFLRSPDADLLPNPEERQWVNNFLADLPVILQPGEACWLYNQYVNEGWRRWHYDDPFLAKVHMLEVRHNLMEELPSEKWARLQRFMFAEG
ncbi:hypothetical protein FJY94_08825 [Candidatus Kaiserbacteria bacterium]|nr:hypothetical protein [Candidatus Kaiserbacteria bacterium]